MDTRESMIQEILDLLVSANDHRIGSYMLDSDDKYITNIDGTRKILHREELEDELRPYAVDLVDRCIGLRYACDCEA